MNGSPLDRFAFGPVAAVRPWMFAKLLYLLLALDVWHTLVSPAWRYGAAGFNVAHFAILDALPIPTTAAYVGMLVVVGAMAFVAVFVPTPPRALSIAITVLYTWGWSCSMLDSYQHHYLVTTLLLATCFFPRHAASDVFAPVRAAPAPALTKKGKRAPRASAPAAPTLGLVRSLGWTMVVVFAGIVYTFTAISKLEPDWQSGAALRNITQNGQSMPGAIELAASWGIDADALFTLLGGGMVYVQALCAIGYFAAPLRDGASGNVRRMLDALGTVALLVALSFHVGAEYIGLQIGWFSYYMIVLAIVAFLPARWLAWLGAFVTIPFRTGSESVFARYALLAPILGLAAAGIAVWSGAQIDLPGAYEAGVVVGLTALAIAAFTTLRTQHRSELGRAALGIFFGMLVCCWSMTTGDERYDYYRFAGGDFRRRHEYRAALEAYRLADRYAPPDEILPNGQRHSFRREDRVREMEQAIRAEGGTP